MIKILFINELAAYFRVVLGWVYKKVSEEKVPHIRIGRNIRFSRSAIYQWLENCESEL